MEYWFLFIYLFFSENSCYKLLYLVVKLAVFGDSMLNIEVLPQKKKTKKNKKKNKENMEELKIFYQTWDTFNIQLTVTYK